MPSDNLPVYCRLSPRSCMTMFYTNRSKFAQFTVLVSEYHRFPGEGVEHSFPDNHRESTYISKDDMNFEKKVKMLVKEKKKEK